MELDPITLAVFGVAALVAAFIFGIFDLEGTLTRYFRTRKAGKSEQTQKSPSQLEVLAAKRERLLTERGRIDKELDTVDGEMASLMHPFRDALPAPATTLAADPVPDEGCPDPGQQVLAPLRRPGHRRFRL